MNDKLNPLLEFAETLNFEGIEGITSDGDEYELGDLLSHAKRLITGNITEGNKRFLADDKERADKNYGAASQAFVALTKMIRPSGVNDKNEEVYNVSSAELWVSCIHAIVIAYGSARSAVIALAARTAVDNIVAHLPDAKPSDFDGIIFRTGRRTLVRWMDEACYVYHALTEREY